MIEFIHPVLRNYRLELFEKLNKKYDVKFVFTGQQAFGGVHIQKHWKYESIPLRHSLANWLRLIILLLKDDYELVVTSPAEADYSLLVYIVCKLRSKKIIFWGESWIWPSVTIIQRLYHNIIKQILERANAIIAMGERQYTFYKKVLKRKEGIFYAPKYVLPYKKRNTSTFYKKLTKEDERIKGKKIVLYMNKIIKRKGLDYLIKAFKMVERKLNNAYLLIVGSGPFEEYCRKLAKELDIKNIMFKGWTDSDVELYHNLCNVLVLPSIFLDGYPEPDGYVLYESMSVGKPLVVTDAVGAAPEFVQDGINGFVVKNKSVEQLANALLKILTDEKLESKMGEESKRIFREKISLNKQFKAFKTAIEYVLYNS